MPKVKFNTPHEFHTKLGLVFNSSIGIPLLPFVYIALEMKNRGFEGIFYNDFIGQLIGYTFPAIAGLMVVHGLKKFRELLHESLNQGALKDKLSGLYSARQYFYLSVGFASALMSIGLYLSTAGIIIVSYVILLFYMSFHLPLPKRYVKDLRLADKDKDVILNQKDYQL